MLVLRTGASAMACEPGCHRAAYLQPPAPPPPGLLLRTCSPSLWLKSSSRRKVASPGGPCLVAWLPGFATFPLGLVRVVFGCSGLLLGLGGGAALWGSQHPLQPHAPHVLGGRDPGHLGQGAVSQEPGTSLAHCPFPSCVFVSWARTQSGSVRDQCPFPETTRLFVVWAVSSHLYEFCWKFLKSCADVDSIKIGLPLGQVPGGLHVLGQWILDVPGRQTCAHVLPGGGFPLVQSWV